MELPDDPTMISIVGVALVEDAGAVPSTLVMLGAVPTMLLLVGLHREGSCLLALGILRLGLWRMWGPRLTTRDSRYVYNSRSQEDRSEST
jgi:hypothetical protein